MFEAPAGAFEVGLCCVDDDAGSSDASVGAGCDCCVGACCGFGGSGGFAGVAGGVADGIADVSCVAMFLGGTGGFVDSEPLGLVEADITDWLDAVGLWFNSVTFEFFANTHVGFGAIVGFGFVDTETLEF